MTPPTAARRIVDALVAQGVEYLFCNLGTDHAPLIEEFARRQAAGEACPEVILCPHENTAVHMAGGYALATGRAQAVLVHVDAGTANAAMALHNLYRTRLPVLLLAGRAPFSSHNEMLGTRNSYVNFVQEPFDQASLVRPYVKWEYQLASGSVAAEVVARACDRANASPQGPVYLMVARETLAEPAANALAAPPASPAFRPAVADDATIAELARRLVAAQSPMLFTAYAGRDPQALNAIEALALLCGMRVIEHTPHTVNLSHGSPCHGGFNPHPFVAHCDVGLLVDVDVPWIPSMASHAPGSWWAHVDLDAEKRGFPLWPFPANLRLQAGSTAVLAQLLAAVRALADEAFRARAAARNAVLARERDARHAAAARDAADAGENGALRAAHVCAAIARRLDAHDVVLNEAVRNAAAVFEQMPRSLAGTRVGPSGGGLGYSAGMGLGIKLARPGARVVNVIGDGVCFFGNPQSWLAVAARYGLPMLTVVLDNGGWAAVKEATKRVYPDGAAAASGAWHARLGHGSDFAMMARSGGAHGEAVNEPAQLEDAIVRCLDALDRGQAALLHVHIAQL